VRQKKVSEARLVYNLQTPCPVGMQEMHKKKRITNAFTLIEILLVIALMGILAVIVIIAINPGRQLAQARNAQRRNDVKTILNALNSYGIDKRGSLPAGLDGTLVMLGTGVSGCNVACDKGGNLSSTSTKISATQGNLGAVLDNGDDFGSGVAVLGDMDGDKVLDYVVGTPLDDDGGLNRGAVYILFMTPEGAIKAKQKISSTVGGLGALANGDHFGSSVVGIGDLDGDGVPDAVVGAAEDNTGGTDRGAIYVLLLNGNGTIKSKQKIAHGSGGFPVGQLDNTDWFGYGVGALGDVDGDKIMDIAVGAPQDDDGVTNGGAVYVIFLNSDGTAKAFQKISDTAGGFSGGMATGDRFGMSAAGAGDMDGDRIPDILVGTPQNDDGGTNRGAITTIFLNASGSVKSSQKLSSTTGGFGTGLTNQDQFGSGIAVSNINLPGRRMVAVGSPYDDEGGVDRGAVWILLLNQGGTLDAKYKLSALQGGFSGPLFDGDNLGVSVSFIGDVDGDYADDLAIGAPLDDDGGTDRGAVWRILLNEPTRTSCLDLSAVLSDYVTGIPYDPSIGVSASTYYAVRKTGANRVVVRSCSAELDEKMLVTY